jgi:Na+-transporting NADH:ubiquinone oxidoreductase subunit A
VSSPQHLIIREGAEISGIITGNVEGAHPTRLIGGGVLTGRALDEGGHIGQEDKAINIIGEGKDPEMFSFFRPGFDKPTFGNTYLSALLPKTRFDMTSNLNGGHRACIACLECPKVCPTDVQPQFLMKSILAGDVEDSVKLGLLDCVECGLCTYVCPSKIELDEIIHDARVALEKEVS